MIKQPFIDVNEFNIRKVSSGSLSRFLDWIGKKSQTKSQFLSKYLDYSFCCSKERWLRFVEDICSCNCLVYDKDRWSRDYDDWLSTGCSYSIYFF